MSQLDLFGSSIPGGRELARRADPATSKESARRASEFSDDHRARILTALASIERRSCVGATYQDIADASGIDSVAVARRIGELERAGAIACVGTGKTSSGRPARLWVRSKQAGVA